MKNSTRRTYAALSVVVAATTGVVLTMTPGAFAAGGLTATNGTIAVDQGGTGVSLIDPANPTAAPKPLPGSGNQAAWSPDGARVVSVVGDQLVTERYDGADQHYLPATLSGQTPNHPTYAFLGAGVVYGDDGRLEVQPADGGYDPSYLLSTTDEPAGVCDFDPTAAGLDDTVFFTRSSNGCDDSSGSIWSYDADSGALTQIVANAFAPALSADGAKMVYASYVNGHAAAFLADPDGTGAQQLTAADDTRDFTSFGWAPDGTSILAHAVATDGSQSVVQIDPATGAVTTLAAGDTHPAWQPLRDAQVARVYGSDSAATNIAASRWTWNTVGKPEPGYATANSAVVVSNANSTIATLAPALANKKGGPVLTTSPKSLDTAVQTELKRILPAGKTVYVLGGTDIVSSSVSTKLTSLGYKVSRIGGSSRYVTSVNVAKAITTAPKTVLLATGQDYHSILEAEAAAGSAGTAGTAVVLMTDNSTMTPSIYDYLNTINPDKTMVVTIGSAGTALEGAGRAGHLNKWPSDAEYYGISASSNVGTSVALAQFWWTTPYEASLVNTNAWKDGVAGFSSMAPYGPVIWTDTATLDSPDKTYLLDESASLLGAVVFGGTGSISSVTATAAGDAMAVPGNWTLVNYLNGDLPTLRSNGAMAPATVRPAAQAAGKTVASHDTAGHGRGQATRLFR